MPVLSLDPVADGTCISEVTHGRAGKGPSSRSFVTVFTAPACSTRSSGLRLRSSTGVKIDWVVYVVHRIGVTVWLLRRLPCGRWGSWRWQSL